MKNFDTKTVPFSAYNQVAFERDLAVKQLSDYGLGLGQRRDENLIRVVRCKDCIYGEPYKKDLSATSKKFIFCRKHHRKMMFWFDFCSKGRRKENNNNRTR